ncbi:hypothetical protein B9Z19DRAFT_1004784 [Tuber borchii]|uniref:Uncharacterized protein n=1 Tax=Tuber borchii TaxID=42251 RepID=A0A2T6ZCZ4_TUBBO|nr:hypothetical protein B9Z19DRAFT_1004784 [Tuber borchii]
MLLDRSDVNPKTVNEHGQTPLFIAAQAGHEGVVKTLLDRVDVSFDIPDLFGRTPLSQALKHGHDAIVKLLSSHGNPIPSLKSDGLPAPSSPGPSDPDQRPPKQCSQQGSPSVLKGTKVSDLPALPSPTTPCSPPQSPTVPNSPPTVLVSKVTSDHPLVSSHFYILSFYVLVICLLLYWFLYFLPAPRRFYFLCRN